MKIEIIHPFFVREPLFRHKPFFVSSTVIKKFLFERASPLVLEVLWIDGSLCTEIRCTDIKPLEIFNNLLTY